MEAVFLILLFALGACFGSFLCCQARRLRLREQGSKKSPKAKKSRTAKSKSQVPARSICFRCHYQLKWYDNIPIISWLALKGRCRKCHRKIGAAEFFSELFGGLAWLALGAALLFAGTPDLTGITSAAAPAPLSAIPPLDWAIFIATLALTLPLGFLAIYDALYGELPVPILTTSIVCAAVVLALKLWASLIVTGFSGTLILQPLGSVLVLAGLYLALYLISKGQWVGDGDWLLALALALALAHAWLALITLFLANLLATLSALPALKRTKQIHFGPFLVAAFIITLTFANFFQTMI